MQRNDAGLADPDQLCPPGMKDRTFIHEFEDEIRRQETFQMMQNNKTNMKREQQKELASKRMKCYSTVLNERHSNAHQEKPLPSIADNSPGLRSLAGLNNKKSHLVHQLRHSFVEFQREEFNLATNEDDPSINKHSFIS